MSEVKIEYEESSGNVSADLGLPNPEERLAGFSIERLFTFLQKLDRDIEIVVRERPKDKPASGNHYFLFENPSYRTGILGTYADAATCQGLARMLP